MSLGLIGTALNLFAPTISKVLEKVIPDTGKRDEIEREIKLALLEQGSEFNKQAGDIILAEAKSEHWLTANWRPLLMIVIVFIVAWNYALAGVMTAIGYPIETIPLPDPLWNLLTVGVGGYTIGRSAEKSMKMYAQAKSNNLKDY